MTLATLFDWFKEQVQYVLFGVMIVVLLVTAYKRAWIMMIGALVGIAFIGVFVFNPDIIENVSEWLAEKLDIGE
ncbi:hypothetical protein GCM10007416_31880 [Kroppenstedtia guangzhouensis]|uniref:Uncharacterized protein n=1 Tax=Kroppenstedtia guangzhouensis TaxID=1274356 RepID=A0ABQ1H266_9BACL|nr:hypothetical protein [Kroppenstedtia guangzhouensis]GGA56287.1 hypothetical protein GCM10007416_31880 [Kroppenstedtia guangzhouensis]